MSALLQRPPAFPRRARADAPATPRAGVLLAVPWDQPDGGLAAVVGNLAVHLRARGHPVVFVHPGDGPGVEERVTAWGFPGYALELRAPSVRGHPVRSPAAFAATLPATLAALRRIVRRHRVRIVNVHYPVEAFAALALLRAWPGTRLVVSVHGSDVLPNGAPRPRYPASTLLQLGAADAVVAPSRGYLRGVLARFPHLAGRAAVVPNGVDLAALDAPCAPDLVPHPPFLLSVATLAPWKGVDTVLRAFAALAPMHPGLWLVLVGGGPDRAALEELARRLGVGARVRFTGEVPAAAVVALLHGCRAFVLASRAESFGLALAEAMACSRPVVATAVGGMPEIVTDGRDGLLVPPDDVGALALALRRVLADDAFARALGARARQTVCARFLCGHTGAAYAALFDRLSA